MAGHWKHRRISAKACGAGLWVCQSPRQGEEFQSREKGHKRKHYRKSGDIKEERLDKKVRQRKEQRRDIYKSIQTLNLCSGHGQKFLTSADLEKHPSSQRRSIDEICIQVRNAEGRAGALVV